MRVTGENYEKVMTFVNKRYVVGSSFWDHNHSSSYLIKEDSVFEIYTDNQEIESYTICVRDNGNDKPLYTIRTAFKDWLLKQ